MTEEDPGKAAYIRADVEVQCGFDGRMFDQVPILIIERYLDSFNTDGTMWDDIPLHILEALAVRFLAFMSLDSKLKTLDEAFGGKLARQRQTRFGAHEKWEITLAVMSERIRLKALPKSERGAGSPHDIACDNVGEQFKMSGDNVRRLYKAAKPKLRPPVG